MIKIQNNKVKISLLAVILTAFLSIFGVSGNAFATVVDAATLQKIAVLQGAERCYAQYMENEVKYGDFESWKSVVDMSDRAFATDWYTDDWVLLPTKVGNTIKDNGLACSHTFGATWSSSGGSSTTFMSYYSMPTTLEGLGYYFDHNDVEDNPDSGQIEITLDSIKDGSGANVIPTTTSGKITITGTRNYTDPLIGSAYYYWDLEITGKLTAVYDGKTIFGIEYNGAGTYGTWPFLAVDVHTSVYNDAEYLDSLAWPSSAKGETLTTATSKLIEAIKNDFVQAFAHYGETSSELGGIYSDPVVTMSVKEIKASSTDEKNVQSVYKPISKGHTSAQIMLYNVGIDGVPLLEGGYFGPNGSGKTKSATWNSNTKYSLYYHYLQNIAKEYPSIKIGPCSAERPESKYAFKGTKDTWCAISIPAADESNVLNTYVAIVGSVYLEGGTIKDILDWFNNENNYKYMDEDKYADFEAEEPEPVPPSEDETDDETKTEEEIINEACFKEAKSLGWIICPIIFGLQEATTKIYKRVEPMIRVSAFVVDQLQQGNSGGGEMYKAWNTFRGIANIIFVILFLFIIFSQLTGFGIDNYGIKKMLPKIIVTAILVNVSFLICALAVDASNIIGKALQDLFTSLAPTSLVLTEDSPTDGTIHAINTAVGLIGVFAGVGAAGLAFYLNGWALIIPILLFLLVMAISIIFALIVLGLRQAFVVILIIVSPIAFACTLLPNTESIFKKWFNLFKEILMVYPIVGGLIGAGYFVARMILTSKQDVIMTITAGLLCVAPYFLVPSLTRKSLDAAGRIGERLRGLGQRAGDRVSRLNNTDAVKNARQNSRANRDEKRAQNWMKNSRSARNIQRDMEAGKTISRRRANKYAQKAALATQSRQASIAARSARSQYNRLSSDSGYQAAMAAANMAEDATTTKNYETMVAAGEYKMDDGRVLDAQDNDMIAQALGAELKKTATTGYDSNKVRALSNMLAAKGKEGRDLMYRTMESAQGPDGKGVSAQAIQDFSSNIMNNHAGTMKEKHRSLYEFAKNTASKEGAENASNISNYATAGIGSLTASDMTNMDLKQLERYVGKDAEGKFNGGFSESLVENAGDDDKTKASKQKQRTQIAQLAVDALNDEHLSQSLSGKTKDALQNIVSAYNATGAPALTPTSQNTVKIDHSADSSAAAMAARAKAVDKYKSMVNARVQKGVYTREEGDRLINNAKAHMFDKNNTPPTPPPATS